MMHLPELRTDFTLRRSLFAVGFNRVFSGLFSSLVLLMVLCWAGSASAQATAVLEFDNVEHEALYNTLIQEYRCLKCQNQNLASSSADLAGDLRREVYERVVADMPREDIDQYLTDRYGDFVLYRPPFKPITWLLWLGPFALLVVALVYALRLSRQHSERQRMAASGKIDSVLPPEKLAEARELLDRSR